MSKLNQKSRTKRETRVPKSKKNIKDVYEQSPLYAIVILAGFLAALIFLGSSIMWLWKKFSIIGGLPSFSGPVNVAILVLLIVFSYIVYRLPSKSTTARILFAGVVTLACVLVAPKNNVPSQRFVIVYDNYTPAFHAPNLPETRIVNLQDVIKLNETGELRPGSNYISTVTRPAISWQKTLDKGFTFSNNILSIQEVIDKKSTRFIDLSFSQFEQEILSFLKRNPKHLEEVKIFFEGDYMIARDRLETALNDSTSTKNVSSFIFNGKIQPGQVSPDSTVIFLGSPVGFETFTSMLASTPHKLMIVPNWIRPYITTIDRDGDAKSIVLVSSVFDNLVRTDETQWITLLKSIDEAQQKKLDVQSNVSKTFIINKKNLELEYQ